VRRKSLISTSLCLAGFCALLLGASGCAGGDDDATIGTPSAAVQGLVDPSAPPAVNLPETQPDTIAPAGTAAMAAPRPVAAAPMLAAPPPPAARVQTASYLTPVPDVEPPLSDAQVQADATEIQQAMARAIPHQIHLSAARQEALISLAQQMAADDHLFIRRPQLVLIVDRASSAQLMALTLARPDGDWEILGTSDVSTGKPGRKQHFKTPVGVLLNDGSELGYRAQGTYNQNHIRGLGVKGMRVWDFGWQTSDDWRTPGATMQVRVEMHATDPAVLEQRLGRADSEGCIRLPDALNRFLDRRGIIDADLERLGETDAGYHALLSPYLAPTPIAGDSVIVVDSSETWVKPYPPETDIALSD
jgi:lipoprotein-anchoring transpeptidase ErfK/SrfK